MSDPNKTPNPTPTPPQQPPSPPPVSPPPPLVEHYTPNDLQRNTSPAPVTDTLAAFLYDQVTMIEFLLHAAVTTPPVYRRPDEYARHVTTPVSAGTLYQRAMGTTIRSFNSACEKVINEHGAQKQTEIATKQA